MWPRGGWSKKRQKWKKKKIVKLRCSPRNINSSSPDPHKKDYFLKKPERKSTRKYWCCTYPKTEIQKDLSKKLFFDVDDRRRRNFLEQFFEHFWKKRNLLQQLSHQRKAQFPHIIIKIVEKKLLWS